MSTENENQNKSAPTTEAAAPSKENITVICGICEGTINNDDTKIACTNIKCGKFTCNVCINLMFEVMLGEPALNYPLSCGACQHKFDRIDVDRILAKQERYEHLIACILPLYWLEDCLEEHEKLAQCPFCPYVEIHTTDACPLYFFTCQHPLCNKRSCLICLHAINDDSDELIHRSQCVELHSYKEMIENAIELGSQQRCPHCQLSGLKDDGCTHIVCERCGLSWCYLCGMKEEECVVDDGVEPTLSAHNQEWDSHEGRCPMSLISIHELDDRWPDDDRNCLEYFHRYRTLCQLYDVLKIIGEEKLDELNDTFGLIDASGYTIDEIKDYEDRILINYSSENNN